MNISTLSFSRTLQFGGAGDFEQLLEEVPCLLPGA
jgi:hypothetical protein